MLTREQTDAMMPSADLEYRFACAFFEPMRLKDRREKDLGPPFGVEDRRVGSGVRWGPGVKPTPAVLSWGALVRGLTRFREVPSKAECPGWMPVRFSSPHRCAANVVEVSCLVLDIDDGSDIEAVSDAFARWPHIVHTSYSSRPDHHKGRLVLPLDSPCPAHLFPRLWEWGQRRLGGSVDEQTKDASRYFYLPALGPGGHNVAHVNDEPDRLLDLRPYAELPETRQEVAARQAARRRAEYEERRQRGEIPAGRARGDELKHDPGARAALGLALGGRVTGNRVKGVTCPACGRPSVWWPIEPHGTPQGMCDHRSSCGATFWLDVLEGSCPS